MIYFNKKEGCYYRNGLTLSAIKTAFYRMHLKVTLRVLSLFVMLNLSFPTSLTKAEYKGVSGCLTVDVDRHG